jgi:hypothetical protein
MARELVKFRELRYYNPSTNLWDYCIAEDHWNSVEQEFVAIMDVVLTNHDRGLSCTIPGFGTATEYALGITYYAGDRE